MTEDSWRARKVAEIMVAYLSNHQVAPADLPNLIAAIHRSLASLAHGIEGPAQEAKPEPAVSIDQSVTSDYIVCLEDGQRFKSLKRHLRNGHGLTPEQYRKKWGLPASHPIVAPNYARKRSSLALLHRLGKGGRKTKPPAS